MVDMGYIHMLYIWIHMKYNKKNYGILTKWSSSSTSPSRGTCTVSKFGDRNRCVRV